MKIIFKLIIIFLITNNILAKEIGETEITTEDGIEVFQNEKFYLLKKNVKIKSDNFSLNADEVKINFDQNLYDMSQLYAKGGVNFDSLEYKMKGYGQSLKLDVKIEKIKVEGLDSKLIIEDIQMFSDGFIEVNNSNGNFTLKGINSELINESILIKGESIDGNFSNKSQIREITFLNVIDDNISFIQNKDTEMYAKIINFNNKTSIVELIDNVTIIRNGEKVTGDYGTLDTNNNSYKIKSNNNTKVKVIIKNDK